MSFPNDENVFHSGIVDIRVESFFHSFRFSQVCPKALTCLFAGLLSAYSFLKTNLHTRLLVDTNQNVDNRG